MLSNLNDWFHVFESQLKDVDDDYGNSNSVGSMQQLELSGEKFVAIINTAQSHLDSLRAEVQDCILYMIFLLEL